MDATKLYGVKPRETARSTVRRAWVIVALLFFFQVINYADKNVLGLAKAGIMHDMNLTNIEWGYIGSSFFILFPLSSIAFGFVANRRPSRWLLLGMGAMWALTQFPMVATVGAGTLLTCRILLGAAEGPGYPVALHATYKWFPNQKRTLPTSLLVLGGGVGASLAGLILPQIIQAWDWHAAFLAVGAAGVVWSLAWLLLGREGTIQDEPHAAAAAGDRVPYRDLVLNPTALGVFLIGFAAYWSIGVGISWGPGYLHEAVGLTQIQAGEAFILPTIVAVFVGPLIGYASQTLFRRGVSSRLSRGAFGCAGVVIGGSAIAGMALAGNATAAIGGFTFPIAVAWFTFANVVMYTIYAVGPPILAEIAPSGQRATLLAINNAIYSSAGIIAPTVMGYVLTWAPDVLTGYRNGYLLLAAILIGAGIGGYALISPARDGARLSARRRRADGSLAGMSPAE